MLSKEQNSNTTFVKVKYFIMSQMLKTRLNSNTTFVKVKCKSIKFACASKSIQIQHLLKLNARKINPYGFYYTIKSINGQGF